MARGKDGKFLPGESGNPGGRMRGTIMAQTVLLRELETHAPEIIQKQIEHARKGNPLVARFLLERLIPVAKSAPIETPVELTGTPADQAEAIVAALAAGSISMDAAQALLHALRLAQEIRDGAELAKRLKSIEAQLAALAGKTEVAAVSAPAPVPALPAPKSGGDDF